MKSLPMLAAFALALSGCETTTTHYPDGGKLVVRRADQGMIVLATRALEVVAYRYPTNPQK